MADLLRQVTIGIGVVGLVLAFVGLWTVVLVAIADAQQAIEGDNE